MKLFMKIYNEDKYSAIENLCRDMDAEYETISYKDLNRSILEIISGAKESDGVSSSIPPLYKMPEIILFSGFDDDALDRFLKEFRKKGIEKVQLKAIVTPYNLNWDLYGLIEHLKNEAKA